MALVFVFQNFSQLGFCIFCCPMVHFVKAVLDGLFDHLTVLAFPSRQLQFVFLECSQLELVTN